MIKNNFNHIEFISLEGDDKDKILFDMRYIAYNLGANTLVNISINHTAYNYANSIIESKSVGINYVKNTTIDSYVVTPEKSNKPLF